ncbi:MAG: efflux RND transporter periplasmic adaptor subunit [Bacteroidales bacterium]|nr:efflux RND transporter periplasmic adaptor subunit [Bacteroidales bacterium]
MKTHFSLIPLALCLLCACGSRSTDDASVSKTAIKVEVLQARLNSNAGVREYIGTLKEMEATSVSFLSPGTVKTINVSEGDFVRRGALIATIDSTQAANLYHGALASYRQALDGYDRLKKVHDGGAVSDVRWVEMETDLEKARSSYELSKKSLEDCSLTAPKDGFVGRVSLRTGENAVPGAEVVSLLDIDSLLASIMIPESDISSLEAGQRCDVEITAAGIRTAGRVSEKSLHANPTLHSYPVKVKIPNPGHKLLPGMLCKVRVSDSGSEAFVIPAEAVLLNTDNSRFVWVVESGCAQRRKVSVGGFAPEGVIITGGLDEGDRIIVKGYQKVGTGDRVTY